ncbi:MAG: hypothetical protein FJ161_03505 [Gammaproteobacteria bacterium]|nr:hypothetical protein [Gammaproteobacteria bacterium]
MEHQFLDTQKHLRMWFSGNPNEFMNLENEHRCRQFQKTNPNAQLTIIYSSNLLSSEGLARKARFEKLYPNIKLIDFDTELKQHCATEKEERIFQIAEENLIAFKNRAGGNLAVVRDILSSLRFVAQQGTYSDHDTNIDVSQLPKKMPIQREIICGIGSLLTPTGAQNSLENITLNNDIIGFAEDENGELTPDTIQFLEKWQEILIHGHDHPIDAIEHSPFPSSLTMQLSTTCVPHFHRDQVNGIQLRYMLEHIEDNLYTYIKHTTPYGILQQLWSMDLQDSELQERLQSASARLFKELADPNQMDFSDAWTEDDKELIASMIVSVLIQTIHQQTQQLSLLKNLLDLKMLPASEISAIEAYVKSLEHLKSAADRAQAAWDNDEYKEVFQALSQLPPDIPKDFTLSNILYKDMVVATSGPCTLLKTLNAVNANRLNSDSNMISISCAQEYSFQNTPALARAYHSHQAIEFQTNLEVFSKNLKTPDGEIVIGSNNDVSWLPAGQIAQRDREAKLLDTMATRIQKPIRSYLTKKDARKQESSNIVNKNKPNT